MGKKGAKIDLESTQKSIEVGLATVWGTCCQQEAGTLLVSTVALWPSHPFSGPHWSLGRVWNVDSSPGEQLCFFT